VELVVELLIFLNEFVILVLGVGVLNLEILTGLTLLLLLLLLLLFKLVNDLVVLLFLLLLIVLIEFILVWLVFEDKFEFELVLVRLVFEVKFEFVLVRLVFEFVLVRLVFEFALNLLNSSTEVNPGELLMAFITREAIALVSSSTLRESVFLSRVVLFIIIGRITTLLFTLFLFKLFDVVRFPMDEKLFIELVVVEVVEDGMDEIEGMPPGLVPRTVLEVEFVVFVVLGGVVLLFGDGIDVEVELELFLLELAEFIFCRLELLLIPLNLLINLL